MKALTLWQPWASLVAMGHKTVETRGWKTDYRGEIAIHSAAKLPPKWLGASRHQPDFRTELADCFNVRRDVDDRCGRHVDEAILALPYGIVRYTVSDRDLIFGNYEDGRYAWWLELVEVFENPIPAKGNRMLWNWER
jgi:hypothetical protein